MHARRPVCLVAAVTFGLAAGLVPPGAGDLAAFMTGEAKTVAAGGAASLDEAERQLDAAWSSQTLQPRRILFVSEKAPVYGAYTPRSSATFKPTDTIVTYIEPVGYSYQPSGVGFVKFGVSLDYEIILPDGTVVGGKKDVMTLPVVSRAHMKELMLNVSLDFDGIPEGDYVLHYTLHDINTGKTAEAKLPFTIANQL